MSFSPAASAKKIAANLPNHLLVMPGKREKNEDRQGNEEDHEPCERENGDETALLAGFFSDGFLPFASFGVVHPRIYSRTL